MTTYWSELDTLFCKSLDEVRKNKYDYIVIGGGAYGVSFVHRMLELDDNCRILVLEKGNIMFPEHYQNLPPVYQYTFGKPVVTPWKMSDKPYNIHGQIPFLGGRALYWNAWVPQPTQAQMQDWPVSVIEGLKQEWNEVDRFIGRATTLEINGETCDFEGGMAQRLFNGLSRIPSSDYYDRPEALNGAMATMSPKSDKGWRRFAPVNILLEDAVKYPKRLDIVVNAEAKALQRNAKGVSAIETTQGILNTGTAKVILSLGVVEAITLTQPAFKENKLLGRNFIGHFRSQLLLRVPKSAAGMAASSLQVAALYLSGMAQKSYELHTHISAIYNPRGEAQYDDVFRIVPDPYYLDDYMDSEHVFFLLQAMAEIKGERSARSSNYISVKGNTTEVHFKLDPTELKVWDDMDNILVEVGKVLSDGHQIQYLHDDPKTGKKTWSTKLPGKNLMRDYNLIHEAGVMWMGEQAKDSVTDTWGRLHETNNTYVLGGALFPTCGSWNPTYTGMALAYRLARKLTK